MSDMVSKAVELLAEKLGNSFDGSAKFVIADEGTIMVDGGGVHAGDADADVTLSADADTFEAILAGDLDATQAFMSGRLTVDGDMSTAMRLGSALA